ncbi:uncharacterized protein DUF262 [Glaciihabitans tibetensis]|uniref:Uncharacterized protein DUF262 n=1 Tax=Glaciihabitans tibetensis TaxID=1266600 RepID=A0A2T0VDW3_9MICO|nr:DUF262 domain-containing protein [Glaciihabitans tibetensis]PRY68379.1 uncharacterized protein DUF262 [Glaciihabitans tibetensis]
MTDDSALSEPSSDDQIAQPDEDVVDVDQLEEVLTAAYDITSYGADYPVDGLIKRMDANDIVIPSFDPAYTESEDVGAFQRGFVWSRPQMDKFIESLLLGLPVPGIFLVRDKKNRLLVLDGQQRLRSLQYFYSGYWGDQRYKLRQVQKPFAGQSYAELDPEDRRRLDDSIIHATVLRQETAAGSQSAVYSIFERLNTGGSPLQPQEIRVALFPGPFLSGLSKLNDDLGWRALYGAKSPRLKDQELILRSLALLENTVPYARPLKGYLNDYLELNQHVKLDATTALGNLFSQAMTLLSANVGPRAFRPVRPVNAAVVDSLSVGLMRRLLVGPITDPPSLAAAYDVLIAKTTYRIATTSSTAAEDSVTTRISEAEAAFASVR